MRLDLRRREKIGNFVVTKHTCYQSSDMILKNIKKV